MIALRLKADYTIALEVNMRPRLHVLSTEATKIACTAVRDYASFAAAYTFLEDSGMRPLLIELARLNQDTLAETIATKKPKIAILNRPELIHFAMIVNDVECARSLASSTTDPTTLNFFPLTGIWKPYALALVRLVTKQSLDVPSIPKCKGYESFFIPYVNYMLSPTAHNALEMNSSFIARNKDRRYVDWVGMDGDGTKPVCWDIRAWTLTKCLDGL